MRRRTSLFVILLSALLMVSMMSAMAFANEREDMSKQEMREANVKAISAKSEGISAKAKRPPLFVGGVGIQPTTEETVLDGVVEDGGTASVVFDGVGENATKATLTLENAVVHGKGVDPEDPDDDRYDIMAEGIDLTIVLIGDNTVGSSGSGNAIKIFSYDESPAYGDLIIKGSGSGSKLIATGETCGINVLKRVYIEDTSLEVSSNSSEAILAWDKENDVTISIKDSDVKAEIIDSLYSSSSFPVAAIHAIKGGVVIDGSTVTATNKCNDGYKGYNYAISSNGDAAIRESTVRATVNNAGKYCDAIYAYDDLTISGDSTSVTAITNCADGAVGCSGMYAHGNDGGGVEISGCKVDAAVNAKENGSLNRSGAIYADNDISLTGANVNAAVNGAGERNDAIYASSGNVEIRGGKVEATVTNGDSDCCGIYAEEKVIINDAKVIAETDSGIAIDGGTAIDITYSESGKYTTYVEAKAAASNSEFMPPAIVTDPGKLSKSDNLAITKPKGGRIENYGEGSDQIATIMDDTNYASHAVIQPSAYKVDVADTTDGKVKVEPESAGEGEEIKVITTPDNGYEVDKIIIVDEDGKETDITEKSAFTMGRSNITVKVTFRKKIGPTITTTAKTSAKTTTVKWSWDKAADAMSYKLAYRKAGSNEWKVKNTKKTKYVIKRQKLKGLYEYKVAAVTSDGDVWSDVSYRYFKGVQARARVSKGAIKVKWKKDKGATGYEILIAKNKKMNGALVIQVAPTSKSYRVTGLEKGKYYVKVRPVKEYNGVTYTGVLCKARKVRIK